MTEFNWKTTTKLPTLQDYHRDGSYEAYIAEIQSIITQLIKDAKTDGWTDVSYDLENEVTTVQRFWATEEDAKAWCDWIKNKSFNGMFHTCEISFIG